MKKLLILIFYSQFFACCIGQNTDKFNVFLNNFSEVKYPINPAEIFYSLDQEWEHYISESIYNTYLRTKSDSIWKFNKEYQYVFGGKFKINNEINCLFYRRVYFAEDINDQISEIVLCTFNNKGEILSDLPISGGYGDSITFSSIIHSFQKIEVNYKKYSSKGVEETTKFFRISEKGNIIKLE